MAKREKKKPTPETEPRIEESKKPPKFSFPTMQPEQPDRGKEIISWSVTPVKYDKKRGIILALSTIAFVLLVYIAYRDWFWPAMALFLSFISFSSFIFPNHYTVTTTGLLYKNGTSVLFRPWERIKRYKTADDGVYLVMQKTVRTRILGPGIFLYYGDVDRDKLHSLLAEYLPQPQKPAGE